MDAFEAIAQPARRLLLEALADRDRTAGELAAMLPTLSQPSVSRHMRVLREAGLVDMHVEAQRRRYTLRIEGMAPVVDWLGSLTRENA